MLPLCPEEVNERGDRDMSVVPFDQRVGGLGETLSARLAGRGDQRRFEPVGLEGRNVRGDQGHA